MKYGKIIAHKLGVLMQYRQGDQKVLSEIADGWDFYCGMFITDEMREG